MEVGKDFSGVVRTAPDWNGFHKTIYNQNKLGRHARIRYPELRVSYMYLLRVLIDSLECLGQL